MLEPTGGIFILLYWFWQVVVSMYNIADFKFRTVATQYKSSSTTGTGSRVEIGFD